MERSEIEKLENKIDDKKSQKKQIEQKLSDYKEYISLSTSQKKSSENLEKKLNELNQEIKGIYENIVTVANNAFQVKLKSGENFQNEATELRNANTKLQGFSEEIELVNKLEQLNAPNDEEKYNAWDSLPGGDRTSEETKNENTNIDPLLKEETYREYQKDYEFEDKKNERQNADDAYSDSSKDELPDPDAPNTITDSNANNAKALNLKELEIERKNLTKNSEYVGSSDIFGSVHDSQAKIQKLLKQNEENTKKLQQEQRGHIDKYEIKESPKLGIEISKDKDWKPEVRTTILLSEKNEKDLNEKLSKLNALKESISNECLRSSKERSDLKVLLRIVDDSIKSSTRKLEEMKKPNTPMGKVMTVQLENINKNFDKAQKEPEKLEDNSKNKILNVAKETQISKGKGFFQRIKNLLKSDKTKQNRLR